MPSLFKRSLLPKLRSFPLSADAFSILPGAADFRRCLLEHIANARQRITLVALYLQQDEAGQEILDALHAAKAARPELEIVVMVDWLRAQRGLPQSPPPAPGTPLSLGGRRFSHSVNLAWIGGN